MKKRFVILFALLSIILLICGCSGNDSDSYFRVTFIDVGHGDSALIECDGEYMLIDAGPSEAGETVVSVLKEKGITQLDILVASHMHDDHIGGMAKVLEYLNMHEGGNKIDLVLSNTNSKTTDVSKEFISKLDRMGKEITIPETIERNAEPYTLGSAKIEVIDNRSDKSNDSLVLLIKYRDTSFLFTGDMEQNQETSICERYGDDERWDITLLKVAHHGSKTSTSIRFLRLLMPQYAVISRGDNKEPEQTLSRLEQADVKAIYRTYKAGNILVEVAPNGRDLNIIS